MTSTRWNLILLEIDPNYWVLNCLWCGTCISRFKRIYLKFQSQSFNFFILFDTHADTNLFLSLIFPIKIWFMIKTKNSISCYLTVKIQLWGRPSVSLFNIYIFLKFNFFLNGGGGGGEVGLAIILIKEFISISFCVNVLFF